ncbi:lysophospholipid acyltransferase family protein [Acinetobacter sp. MD2(2019)]|uniref:lysophospholipid acyltransferase family protein n=1 Tax=Acinetobacter sp. MD2(2019) TaxID=2605273 RepID=UPI002D1EC361|nr:lysophospholipid acyltransferase family protein [Acinetobacter sp. MD2(2019)]MEB3754541.1 1-acyl-sn-glycerol-3-phosphate acyltransferase [Acinetobacter sp. MD2(2019)]
MTQQLAQPVEQQKKGLARVFHFAKKLGNSVSAVSEGFYVVYRHQLYKQPNAPENTRYVQWFCRRLCKVFNIEVQIHGDAAQRDPALWVSNHVSWLDIPVLGSGARVFFLAKAEIEQWPLLGKLAKGGGTLFIKRGSGDSLRIREEIAKFLTQGIPVLFFPEATTSDGTYIKRIHGRLLGAAIEAQRPVQIALIAYVNQQGELDHVAPYFGDISFTDHVKRVLEMPKVTAHLMFLPRIDVTGKTLEVLTKEVQENMQKGLQALHQNILAV